jgi:hypothetical protein
MRSFLSFRLLSKASIASLIFSAGLAVADPVPLPPAPLRPGAGDGPTQVGVTAWFADISKIDSAAQSFTVNLFLLLQWKDPALAHSGPESVSYALDQVWHPRCVVSNAGGDLRNTLPEKVEVSSDGVVSYRQRFVGSLTESLNLWRFPFDSETFTTTVVVLGSRPEDVILIPDPGSIAKGLKGAIGRNEVLTIPDWKVTKLEAGAAPYRLVPGTEIPGYNISFSAYRLRQHYILKVILPLLLIVLMSFSVYWIDPTLGASQISVAVTSMLTLIAYRFAIGADTPKLPYLTLMDAFILLGTLMVFLSLMEVILTTRLALTDRVHLARAVDRKCRFIFPLLLFLASAALYFFW